MRTAHDEVLDDLDALVAGDRDAIARHADHLASCDQCRDAKHEAAHVATMLRGAGSDYVPNAGLIDTLLAKIEAPKELPRASQPKIEAKIEAKKPDAEVVAISDAPKAKHKGRASCR